MVSDIGGNLGLLLGASLFALYEFIESCLSRCWQRRKTGLLFRNSSAVVDVEVMGGRNSGHVQLKPDQLGKEGGVKTVGLADTGGCPKASHLPRVESFNQKLF